MASTPRDPLKFDGTKLFFEFLQDEGIVIHAPGAKERFLARLQEKLDHALQSDSFLHGNRTQAMFLGLIRSLGEAVLIKEEDAGAVFAEGLDVRPPDFRVVLRDETQMLVEVKNFFQTDPVSSFEMRREDLNRLKEYARLTKCDLKIAIFWVKWGIWSLVSPQVLQAAGDRFVLKMPEAFTQNEMHLLGDKEIGTVYPLRLVFYFGKADANNRSQIHQIKVFCQDRELTGDPERTIALYLIFYGSWTPTQQPIGELVGDIRMMEYSFSPQQPTKGQSFEFVDSLSKMFSRFHLHVTSEGGKVTKMNAPITPGGLGRMIPLDYTSDMLPLWRFTMVPKGLGKPGSPRSTSDSGT